MKIIGFIFIFLLLTPNCYSNSSGQRILKSAQRYGMTDSDIKFLLENSSPDLTVTDSKNQRTAVHWAAIKGRPNMVRTLIAVGGADKDPLDKYGKTPLMYAVIKGHVEIVKILMELGADNSIKDKNNKTSADHARLRKNQEIISLVGTVKKSGGRFKNRALGVLSRVKTVNRISEYEKAEVNKFKKVRNILRGIPKSSKDEKKAKLSLKMITKILGKNTRIKEKDKKRSGGALLKMKAIGRFAGGGRSGSDNDDGDLDSGGDDTDELSRLDAIRSLIDVGWNRNDNPDDAEKIEDIGKRNNTIGKIKIKMKAIGELLDVKEKKQVEKVSLRNAILKVRIMERFKNLKAHALEKKLAEVRKKEADERKRAEENAKKLAEAKNKSETLVVDQYPAGPFQSAGKSIDEAFRKSWEGTKRRHRNLKKALGGRVLQCGVYNIIPAGGSSLGGSGLTRNSDGTSTEVFSNETVSLGNVIRTKRNIKMGYNKRNDFVYINLIRGRIGSSHISVKNYTSDNKKDTYITRFKIRQNFKMKDLETGKALMVPFIPGEGGRRWVTCKLRMIY